MKKIKVFLVIFILIFSGIVSAVNLNNGKGLACEAILCAVGIAIPASHSKCKDVLKKWSIYLATHPWDSTPKCPKINAESEVVGHILMDCDDINDNDTRQQCLNAENERRNIRCEDNQFDEECECPNDICN